MSLSDLDDQVGFSIYYSAQRSVLRHLATFVSFVGVDMWYVVALLLAALRFNAEALEILPFFRGLDVDFFLELFNEVMVLMLLSSYVKLLLGRLRPVYAEQRKIYVATGDFYSFPSGHSCCTCYLLRQLVILLALDNSSPALARGLVFGVTVLVSWARVAKGRHYPIDSIVGAGVGEFAAEMVTHFGFEAWGQLKFAVVVVGTVELFFLILSPKHRTPGFNVAPLALFMLWASAPFKISRPLGDNTEIISYPLAAFCLLGVIFYPQSLAQSTIMVLTPSSTSLARQKHE